MLQKTAIFLVIAVEIFELVSVLGKLLPKLLILVMD